MSYFTLFNDPPFAPTNIKGLQLWLDPADSSTITTDTGVSQWNDKSGNSNNASQGTGANQPTATTINSVPAISFVSADDNFMTIADDNSLDFDGGAGFSIALVVNFDGFDNQGSGINLLLAKGNGTLATDAWNLQANSGNRAIFQSGNNETIVENSGTFNGAACVLVMTMDNSGTQATIRRNGGTTYTNATATVGSDNATDITIGGGTGSTVRYGGGDFGDIIIYNKPLSTDEINRIEGYLANKYSLQSLLPSDHPFK